MTDKDSQLDEIEQLAVSVDAGERTAIDLKLFQPGGVYYEMRRENQKLFHDTGKGCSV